MFKALDRHHPVDHCRDAEECRDAFLLDDFQCQLGIKVNEHNRTTVSHVVHGKCDRNMEHLPRQHVNVGGYDAFGDGLIQHAHIQRVVRVQGTLGFAGGAAGVENQNGIIACDVCR